MDDIEALLTTIRTFYAKLERLRAMEKPEFLLPDRSETYTWKMPMRPMAGWKRPSTS